jgi:hypothetical protein
LTAFSTIVLVGYIAAPPTIGLAAMTTAGAHRSANAAAAARMFSFFMSLVPLSRIFIA